MSGLNSALFTGLSGLSVNQQQLSVIGNNIANSNTTAFKTSRVIFTTEAYVTQNAGSAASSNFGGSNPSQTGLGATIGAIETNFTPGQISNTGLDTDMAISGNGFFVTQSPNGQQFTRNGAFTLNANNQLVTTNGAFVQGYGVDANGNIDTSKLQNITIPLNSLTTAQQTQNAAYTGTLDAGGPVATTGSVLTSEDLTTVGGGTTPNSTTLLTNIADASSNTTPMFAVGDTLTTNADLGNSTSSAPLAPLSFTVTSTSTLQDLQDFMTQGLQIDTGASFPTGSPAPGVTLAAGTAANSVDLNITGNVGNLNNITHGLSALLTTTGTNGIPNFTATTIATGESAEAPLTAFDSLGNPVSVHVTATLQSVTPTGTVWQFVATSPDTAGASTFTAGTPASTVVGQGTLTFDGNGDLVSSTGTTINIDRTGTGANSPMQINLDFSGMHAENTTNSASSTDSGSSMQNSSQDGKQIGTLTSFSVGNDGTIMGEFDNQAKRVLGQVVVATFTNQEGLTQDANNMYSAGADSGQPIISGADTLGAGSISGASLEGSNVDLSTEFVNLIMASTGFSAASKVISTADQLVQDLLNANR
jgi:flagellar hook protein FlgE